ncbi:MAG: hypothetical protein P8M71_01670 [Pseudomonadales bacterium]|nr:hypothetical protein [Pseudomonadales bacterium]
MSDLALDPSIRLNKQLEQLLQLMKVFSYKKNIVDNQKLVNTISAIEVSLQQVKPLKADTDHCRGLLSRALTLMQIYRHSVDPVTFLDNNSLNNVVPIRPVSTDFVDASFERILAASDAFNPAYVSGHFDESLEAYLTEPDATKFNDAHQQTQRHHLSLVASNRSALTSNETPNSKPNSNNRKGK